MIDDYLKKIKEATYGEEVRSSICNAISQCYKDATGHPDSVAAVVEGLSKEITDRESADDAERKRVDAKMEALVDKIYPVGAIYMSVNSTSPSILFGGTWETWGAGRMPVSVDASTDWLNKPEVTGGEYKHTLTADEMPSHRHTVNAVNIPNGGAHSHSANKSVWVGQDEKNIASGTSTGRTMTQDIMGSGGAHTHTVPAHNTNYTGSGVEHNNMPPYISVYMWKRVK